jgi:hypothetical protein
VAVVTPGDLKNYMSGISMNPVQEEAAYIVIAGVQQELERYINRPVELTLVREAVLTSPEGYGHLSVTPVHRIESIRAVQSAAPWTLPTGIIEGPELPAFDGAILDYAPANYGAGLLVPGGIDLGLGGGYFVITYTGGGGPLVAQYLDAIKLAVLRVASREFQQMHDDSMTLRNLDASEPVDPISVPRRGWTQDELRDFDRLRRRVVV